jgi:hypothetical protein
MIPCRIYAGTGDGLVTLTLDRASGLTVAAHGLRGNEVRGLAVDPRDPSRVHAACGLRGWGLHLTTDGGLTFSTLGFDDRWVWDVVHDPADPKFVFVGTEPPMLYRGDALGTRFSAFPGIDSLPSRGRWTFFHPPFHAGHVHGIALSAKRPGRIIAGIEHGALIYSHDRGKTWFEALVGGDLHRVAVDPLDPDRIWAGAGNGLHVSVDGARSWRQVTGLRGRYVHGIVFDPRDPARMYVYVDGDRCPVYKSEDRGDTWQLAGTGMLAARPADPIRLHPEDPSVVIYAGDVGNGSRLFLSPDEGMTWEMLGPTLPKVWRLQVTALDEQPGARRPASDRRH